MKTKLSISIDQGLIDRVRKLAQLEQVATSQKIEQLINLGCANGWQDTPELIRNCKHELKIETVANCLTRYTCEICKYSYSVDSSD